MLLLGLLQWRMDPVSLDSGQGALLDNPVVVVEVAVSVAAQTGVLGHADDPEVAEAVRRLDDWRNLVVPLLGEESCQQFLVSGHKGQSAGSWLLGDGELLG